MFKSVKKGFCLGEETIAFVDCFGDRLDAKQKQALFNKVYVDDYMAQIERFKELCPGIEPNKLVSAIAKLKGVFEKDTQFMER